jgi:hypothetical protein
MPRIPILRRFYPAHPIIAICGAKPSFMVGDPGTYNYRYSLRSLEGTAGFACTGKTITGIRTPRRPITVPDLSLLCKGPGSIPLTPSNPR